MYFTIIIIIKNKVYNIIIYFSTKKLLVFVNNSFPPWFQTSKFLEDKNLIRNNFTNNTLKLHITIKM